jgi:hypothetical protein
MEMVRVLRVMMMSGNRRPSGIGEAMADEGESDPRRGGVASIILGLSFQKLRTCFLAENNFCSFRNSVFFSKPNRVFKFFTGKQLTGKSNQSFDQFEGETGVERIGEPDRMNAET